MPLKQADMRLNGLRKSSLFGKKSIGKTEHYGLVIKKKRNHIKNSFQRRRNEVMVDVLLFAELQEKAGSEKLSIEADGVTVKERSEERRVGKECGSGERR